MTALSGWSTHLNTQVPPSQTCRHTCSALATCDSANHHAAVGTPIKILLIIASAAFSSCNPARSNWFLSFCFRVPSPPNYFASQYFILCSYISHLIWVNKALTETSYCIAQKNLHSAASRFVARLE